MQKIVSFDANLQSRSFPLGGQQGIKAKQTLQITFYYSYNPAIPITLPSLPPTLTMSRHMRCHAGITIPLLACPPILKEAETIFRLADIRLGKK